ncbi:hypothetical protein ACFV42_29560 [Streptomyces solisilvae]|uniref:hypothetical protein n=1 Tax=Streptomyces malaysiensis TaxID=92644 RepID=UPI00368773E1
MQNLLAPVPYLAVLAGAVPHTQTLIPIATFAAAIISAAAAIVGVVMNRRTTKELAKRREEVEEMAALRKEDFDRRHRLAELHSESYKTFIEKLTEYVHVGETLVKAIEDKGDLSDLLKDVHRLLPSVDAAASVVSSMLAPREVAALANEMRLHADLFAETADECAAKLEGPVNHGTRSSYDPIDANFEEWDLLYNYMRDFPTVVERSQREEKSV